MSENVLQHAAFLDLASIHPGDLQLTELKTCVPEWSWFDRIGRDELLSVIHKFDLVVCNKVVLDAGLIQKADRLKLICVSATGVNNVDLDAVSEKGITVCNVQAYATASVVQHVFASLLTLITRLDESRKAVSDKDWSRSENFCVLGIPITELQGKTLGIVGFGELGSAVARVAEAFGMKVLVARRDESDTREGRLPLNELLPQVDVLSLHCPLNEVTRNLIGRDELSLMKPDAFLLNTARGGLVDEVALLEVLGAGGIAGAALDVLEQEPPGFEHPLIDAGLPNLLITPHVAWASRESRQRLVDELVKNISAYEKGERRNVVTHP